LGYYTQLYRRRLLLTRGRVHWYTKGTGHGFIKAEDGGPMAFVRREDLAAGEEEDLKDNDEVSFEVVQGTEGPEARNVSRV
jgi:cold shock protein